MHKTYLQKRIIPAWFFTLVVCTIWLFSCKTNKPAPSYINPAFGEYISSYTAGVISSTSTIKIVLSKDVVTTAQIGKDLDNNLFPKTL
jgi:alpha-2-macroglobulin